jgi:hypothetical protein
MISKSHHLQCLIILLILTPEVKFFEKENQMEKPTGRKFCPNCRTYYFGLVHSNCHNKNGAQLDVKKAYPKKEETEKISEEKKKESST